MHLLHVDLKVSVEDILQFVFANVRVEVFAVDLVLVLGVEFLFFVEVVFEGIVDFFLFGVAEGF